MRIFFEKNCKIASASGAQPPNPRLLPAALCSASDTRVVTPAYYYNFTEFVSSAKCILRITFKEEKNSCKKWSAFAFSAFLHLFFTLNSLDFVDEGARIFLASGRRVP